MKQINKDFDAIANSSDLTINQKVMSLLKIIDEFTHEYYEDASTSSSVYYELIGDTPLLYRAESRINRMNLLRNKLAHDRDFKLTQNDVRELQEFAKQLSSLLDHTTKSPIEEMEVFFNKVKKFSAVTGISRKITITTGTSKVELDAIIETTSNEKIIIEVKTKLSSHSIQSGLSQLSLYSTVTGMKRGILLIPGEMFEMQGNSLIFGSEGDYNRLENWFERLTEIGEKIKQTIEDCDVELLISSPRINLPNSILLPLKKALDRGIKVKIITAPKRNNQLLILHEMGCQIEFLEGFHLKMILADERVVMYTSANFTDLILREKMNLETFSDSVQDAILGKNKFQGLWEKAFLDRMSRSAVSYADRIRQFALEKYVNPARKLGKKEVSFCARDIHNGLGFTSRYPNVIQAIEGQKFRKMVRIKTIEKVAPPTAGSGLSSTICWNITLE